MTSSFVEFTVTVEPLTTGVRVTLDDDDRAPVAILAATAQDALRMIAPHMAAVAALVCDTPDPLAAMACAATTEIAASSRVLLVGPDDHPDSTALAAADLVGIQDRSSDAVLIWKDRCGIFTERTVTAQQWDRMAARTAAIA